MARRNPRCRSILLPGTPRLPGVKYSEETVVIAGDETYLPPADGWPPAVTRKERPVKGGAVCHRCRQPRDGKRQVCGRCLAALRRAAENRESLFKLTEQGEDHVEQRS